MVVPKVGCLDCRKVKINWDVTQHKRLHCTTRLLTTSISANEHVLCMRPSMKRHCAYSLINTACIPKPCKYREVLIHQASFATYIRICLLMLAQKLRTHLHLCWWMSQQRCEALHGVAWSSQWKWQPLRQHLTPLRCWEGGWGWGSGWELLAKRH